MATWIYKDGKKHLCEYHALQRHLNAGWSTSPNPQPVKAAEPKAEPAEPATLDTVPADQDQPDLSNLSRVDLIELAQSKGHKNISRLKRAELEDLLS